MKLTYFKRMNCALCGRKAAMRFVRGRLKTAPHRKVWICTIHCSHCKPRVNAVALSKEAAKVEAVRRWNARQAQNLVAMERFLKKIFASHGE